MATEYVAFCSVTEEHFALIELHHRQLPSIRILHDAKLRLLIVKLMAGKPHEWVISDFVNMFKDMVWACTNRLFYICDMRITRFIILRMRSKEREMMLLSLHLWDKTLKHDLLFLKSNSNYSKFFIFVLKDKLKLYWITLLNNSNFIL